MSATTTPDPVHPRTPRPVSARAWTVREVATPSAVSPACLDSALRRLVVSDRAVVRTLVTPASRAPMSTSDG